MNAEGAVGYPNPMWYMHLLKTTLRLVDTFYSLRTRVTNLEKRGVGLTSGSISHLESRSRRSAPKLRGFGCTPMLAEAPFGRATLYSGPEYFAYSARVVLWAATHGFPAAARMSQGPSAGPGAAAMSRESASAMHRATITAQLLREPWSLASTFLAESIQLDWPTPAARGFS